MIASLVIQGLIADVAARDAEIVRLRAEIVDLVAEVDCWRESHAAALSLLRDAGEARHKAQAKAGALKREMARYTSQMVKA